MFRLVVLVLCSHTLSQPVTNDVRPVREATECCPCPGARDDLLAANSQAELARDSQPWPAGQSRISSPDDCPCRAGDADPESAPSFLFTTALSSDGSQLKSAETRDESKNLLEPEVNLAASVLDTIREATEEEYRDALEREAVRNAEEPDAAPEESARNVVIIVNPNESEMDDDDDEFLSEASHIQESRCIHPIDTTSLGKMRSSAHPISIEPGSFKTSKADYPSQLNLLHFDNDLGASSVDETIVETNVKTPLLTSNTQEFDPAIPLKSSLDTLNDLFRINKPNTGIQKFDDAKIKEAFKYSSVPRLNTRPNVVKNNLRSATSTLQHQLGMTTDKINQLSSYDNLPLHLRNLLKLRDVELIPKTMHNKIWSEPTIDVSRYTLLLKPNQIKNNGDEDQFFDKKVIEEEFINDASNNVNVGNSLISASNESFSSNEETVTSNENFEPSELNDERNVMEETQLNLDSVSSPSQTQPSVIIDNEEDKKILKSVTDCSYLSISNENMNTELKNDLDVMTNIGRVPSDVVSSEDETGSTIDNDDINCDVELKEKTDPKENMNIEKDSDTSSSNKIINTMLPYHQQEKSSKYSVESRDSEEKCGFLEKKDNIMTPTGNDVEAKPFNDALNLSMNDLQKMSDRLLDSRNSPFIDDTQKSSENNDSRNKKILNQTYKPEFLNNEGSRTCLTNPNTKSASINKNNTIKTSEILSTQETEMDTGASNTLPVVLDTLNSQLRSRPLLSDIVLRSSNDPLNLLGKPISSSISLKPNLFNFNSASQKIAETYNKHDRNIEVENNRHLARDFANMNPSDGMVTLTSTRYQNIESPVLEKLQKSYKNAIKNKPKILSPFDFKPKSQMLELNKYMAHLPSPSSLDLSSLNVVPKLRNMAEKTKPINNFKSDRTILRKTNPITALVNPLSRVPTLKEVTSSFKLNTKKIPNSSINPELNLFSENLQLHDVENIVKNAQLNAEKTLKGLQRKMKSSLRTQNLHNPLEDSLTNPHEILNDMNDKLKGLHYDLNERLSAMRENILDSSKLNILVNEPFKSSNRNVMTNLRKSNNRFPSQKAMTLSSTTNQEFGTRPFRLESKNHVNPDWSRSQKTQTEAESAPSPATLQVPKSVNPSASYMNKMTNPFRQNPIETVLQRSNTQTPIVSKDVKRLKDLKSPRLRTTTNPFNNNRQQNEIKISFETTTTQPLPLKKHSRPVIRVPNKPQMESNFGPTSGAVHTSFKSKPVANSKVAPLRTFTLLPSAIDEDYEDTLNNFRNEELPSEGIKPRPSIFKVSPKSNMVNKNNNLQRFNLVNEGSHVSKSTKPMLDWSKATKEFVFPNKKGLADTRIMDNSERPIKNTRTEQFDLLRSPTESQDVVIDEPLKENVPYKCRMVCTKEIK